MNIIYSTPKALKGDRVTLLVDGEEYTGTVMGVKASSKGGFIYEVLVAGGMVRNAPDSEIVDEE